MSSAFPLPSLPRVAWKDSDERRAFNANNAPRMPWNKFMANVFHPLPGEHVGIIGVTGQGKTHLMKMILPLWPFVAGFATKNQDETMDALIREGGYERFDKWYQLSPIDHPRRVIWPKVRNLKSMKETQKGVFENAIEHIWAEGGRPKDKPIGWAIAMDELWWFSSYLDMGLYVKILLQQGRSAGISLIAATQRPYWVPLELYSNSTHLFFFQDADENNLKRIGEINSRHKAAIRMMVSELDLHQVLYVNTRTGQMARTRAPIPK